MAAGVFSQIAAAVWIEHELSPITPNIVDAKEKATTPLVDTAPNGNPRATIGDRCAAVPATELEDHRDALSGELTKLATRPSRGRLIVATADDGDRASGLGSEDTEAQGRDFALPAMPSSFAEAAARIMRELETVQEETSAIRDAAMAGSADTPIHGAGNGALTKMRQIGTLTDDLLDEVHRIRRHSQAMVETLDETIPRLRDAVDAAPEASASPSSGNGLDQAPPGALDHEPRDASNHEPLDASNHEPLDASNHEPRDASNARALGRQGGSEPDKPPDEHSEEAVGLVAGDTNGEEGVGVLQVEFEIEEPSRMVRVAEAEAGQPGPNRGDAPLRKRWWRRRWWRRRRAK